MKILLLAISASLFMVSTGHKIVAPLPTSTLDPGKEKLSDIVTDLQRAEKADLCFLVDITGSMGPYIEGVKKAVLKIVRDLNKAEIEKLRLAFVGYRDLSDTKPFEILDFTEVPIKFRGFVSKQRANGGGDYPEDVFGGLEKVPQLKWDPEAGTRLMFHIADAPSHQKDPKNRSLSKLLGDLKEKKIEYTFGRINPSGTDKMLGEFSEVCGEEIPQVDIAVQRSGPVGFRSRRVSPGSAGRIAAVRPGGGGAPRPDASESIAEGALESLSRAFGKAKERISGKSG